MEHLRLSMVLHGDLISEIHQSFVHVFGHLCFLHLNFKWQRTKFWNDFSSSTLNWIWNLKDKEVTPPYTSERSKSASCLKTSQKLSFADKEMPPPIPPLPLNYQRSDGELETCKKKLFLKWRMFVHRWRQLCNERVKERTQKIARYVQGFKASWAETVSFLSKHFNFKLYLANIYSILVWELLRKSNENKMRLTWRSRTWKLEVLNLRRCYVVKVKTWNNWTSQAYRVLEVQTKICWKNSWRFGETLRNWRSETKSW